MIIVFWRQGKVYSDSGKLAGVTAEHAEFDITELTRALAFCEMLRKKAKDGDFISHVCISTELPGSVGQAGASTILPDEYSWWKRRLDPSIPLGREKVT